MFSSLFNRFGKTYQPLNKIEISELYLRHNYEYLSSLNPSLQVAPVLKSNAYGHGLIQIAKVLDTMHAPYFCVDSLYEAYELLKGGIKTKILIMGYVDPENLQVKKLPFSYVVYDESVINEINKYQKGAGIHIKFDSGMNRLGVKIDDLSEFLDKILKYKNIHIEGFMSHFAESENPTSELTKLQLKNIQQALALMQKKNIKPQYIHIGNSAALLHQKELQLAQFSNMVRTGIDLYGIDPRSEKQDAQLKPILRFTTKIVQMKRLTKGERVGYNGTYTAKRDMTIALLPIGYYDGIDRRLSNKGVMRIGDNHCPIIGRVSMNITAIDITTVKDPKIGQEVLVYSELPDDKNSIKNAATLCDTIPYDLFVHLASTTRREVI